MRGWASEPDGVGAGYALVFERGLAPEAGGQSERQSARTFDYRDDKTVDALVMTVSMATS
jgi:hypothetical protein